MSPTRVYSSRSSDPSRAAAASPVDSPRPSPNGGRPSARQRPLISACRAGMSSAAATARSAWSGCENGAPKTAITASPTNCITVPSSPRMAWFMAARCVLSWPASWLGSACSAMVEYDRMSLISTVTSTTSVFPMSRPSRRSFSASPPGSRRDRDSPCSSRSTMHWWSSRSRRRAPSVPAETPWASLTNSASTWVSTASGVVRWAAAMALMGLPSATQFNSVSSESVRPPWVVTGRDEGIDDGGVECGAAGGHRPHRVDQLVALGDVVLEEVAVAGRAFGHQGDRVLGVVVLRQDDHTGARTPLADLTGRVDALARERWVASGCR